MFKLQNKFKLTTIFLFLFVFLRFFIINNKKLYAYPLLDKETTGIYTELQEVNNAKANIIITHGIGESSKEYEKLANYLNQFGYNVLIYDIRSHGRSRNDNSNVADIDTFHTFLDDLNLIINSLKQKNNLKNILIGHSLGGMINNCYVYKYKDIDGVINSGSPIKIIDSAKNFSDEKNIQNMNNVPVNINYEILSRLPLTQEMKNYRSVKFLTPNFVRNTMILSIEYFRENLIDNSYCYPAPILLLHGVQDQIISSENSQEIFDLIQNKDKKLKLYPSNYHNLFNDLNNEQIYQDVIEWLEEHFNI